MAQKKQKKMTREEALQLYQDLQSQMTSIMRGKAPGKVAKPAAQPTMQRESAPFEGTHIPATQKDRGVVAAVTFLLFCCMVKLGVGVIDYLGIVEATPAQAVIAQSMEMPRQIIATSQNGLTPEEVKILTSLDTRRAELEEKGRRLDDRESDISKRDKEYVVKLAEIRELTDRLKLERDKDDKKRSGQLDQLANVYGAMAPQEAAQLIEQLDVTIALPLLQRLPEKKMGQILPMMSSERALAITKLLSGKIN